MGRTPNLVTCQHQIVPQDCPYCELERLRARIATLERQLSVVDVVVGFPDGDGHGRIELVRQRIVNAYIDGAAVGNHGDVQKRAEAYARDILAVVP